MKVAVVGCGRVGEKRAAAIRGHGDLLEIAADLDLARARALEDRYGCEPTGDWRQATSRDGVEAVVVSTDHSALAEVARHALASGKHVLCEKPLGRNAAEAMTVVRAAEEGGLVLKAGFNHRFHPHVMAARRLAASGEIGRLLFARALLGHGGRPGMAGEWRASHAIAGGGALLDQGVHVVDLLRWFLGELDEVSAWTAGYVWGQGRPPSVEDNVFAMLRAPGGAIASLHVSWTQWRNRFELEFYGEGGSVAVQGLGGETYGRRLLRLSRRQPGGGPPLEEATSFPSSDTSWQDEWSEFRQAIDQARAPMGNGHDALAALRIVDAAYRSAAESRVIRIGPE